MKVLQSVLPRYKGEWSRLNLTYPWIRGVRIAESYNTWHWTSECCALGREYKPQWGQNFFGLSTPSTLKNFQKKMKSRLETQILNYHLLIICKFVLFVKVGKSRKWNKTFFFKKNLPMNKLCLLPLLLFTFGLFQASKQAIFTAN